MAKNKIGLQFSGFEEMIEKLDRLEGDVKAVTEECLIASHEHITSNVKKDMRKHRFTGDTEDSIIVRPKVEWEGSTASIDIGFDLKHGGMPSIFLMYGTPRMPKDTKLYNDIYGNSTKRKIAEIQEEIFAKAVTERMEG